QVVGIAVDANTESSRLCARAAVHEPAVAGPDVDGELAGADCRQPLKQLSAVHPVLHASGDDVHSLQACDDIPGRQAGSAQHVPAKSSGVAATAASPTGLPSGLTTTPVIFLIAVAEMPRALFKSHASKRARSAPDRRCATCTRPARPVGQVART